MTQTDYMNQEKEEGDSPALKIVLMQQFRDLKKYIYKQKKKKGRLITAMSNKNMSRNN